MFYLSGFPIVWSSTAPVVISWTGADVPSYLRPGHYTVKNIEHGHECLRCGMKGWISDIKATKCTNPTGEPNYYYENDGEEVTQEPPAALKPTPLTDAIEEEAANLMALEQEYQSLRALEHQLAMVEEMQQEQEYLEALEHEQLMMEMKGVCGREEEVEKECEAYWERHRANMKSKLMKIKFPEKIATWAVETSNGEWPDALEKAYKKMQEEERKMVQKVEEEDEKKKKGRAPATPCASNRQPPPVETMPPPNVPSKKLKVDTPCTMAGIYS